MRGLIALLLLLGTMLAHAEVVTMGKAQLQHALQEGPPCCVIDGRSEKSRRQRPLADALVYRADIKIVPTAAVVVLADEDRQARKIAEALAAAHPGKRIIAVEGGLAVWQAVQASATQSVAQRGGINFVIPKNTCESGTPLQELTSGSGKH